MKTEALYMKIKTYPLKHLSKQIFSRSVDFDIAILLRIKHEN